MYNFRIINYTYILSAQIVHTFNNKDQNKEVIKMEREILTLEEAAEYLRMNPEVLRRHAKKGEIPGKQIGRVWKFSKNLLQKYIEEGYNGPVNTNRKDRE